MPTTTRSAMGATAYPRTILFPSTPSLTVPSLTPVSAGSSDRGQWLVRAQGAVWRRRRVSEFPVGRRQLTLGRGRSCAVRVNDPHVAPVHAVLLRKPRRGVYLRDLASDHGTFVNGERVREEVLLMDGDRIRLGSGTSFVFIDSHGAHPSRVRRWARRARTWARV